MNKGANLTIGIWAVCVFNIAPGVCASLIGEGYLPAIRGLPAGASEFLYPVLLAAAPPLALWFPRRRQRSKERAKEWEDWEAKAGQRE